MAGKKRPAFDQEAAFKSIIGAGQEESEQKQQEQDTSETSISNLKKDNHGKGRPKTGSETKKRVTLALYPSIYSDLQKIAYVQRKSISEIVSNLVTSFINENTDKLEEYEIIKNNQRMPEFT